MSTRPTSSLSQRLVQIAGFVGSLALLGWCVQLALSPENRDQISRLGEAPPQQVVLLIAYGGASMLLNGLLFYVQILPSRRIRHSDIQAVNAIAYLLAFLPFKLSIAARVLFHAKRDRLPLLVIGAWFGAVGAVALIAFGPLMLAGLVSGEVDAVWWSLSIGGVFGATAATIALARVFAGDEGLKRMHALIDRTVPLEPGRRLFRTKWFLELHEGFGMLSHVRIVCLAVALRLLDLGVQVLRFLLACAILGVEIGVSDAVLLATTYFLIGSLSPFGMLGPREAGTTGLAALLSMGESFAGVTLFITGTESIAILLGTVCGIGWLGPRSLLKPRASTVPTETPEPYDAADAPRPVPIQSDDR